MYTVEEVSIMLRIPESTVRYHLRNNYLRGVKIGKLWRIPAESLKVYGINPSDTARQPSRQNESASR